MTIRMIGLTGIYAVIFVALRVAVYRHPFTFSAEGGVYWVVFSFLFGLWAGKTWHA